MAHEKYALLETRSSRQVRPATFSGGTFLNKILILQQKFQFVFYTFWVFLSKNVEFYQIFLIKETWPRNFDFTTKIPFLEHKFRVFIKNLKNSFWLEIFETRNLLLKCFFFVICDQNFDPKLKFYNTYLIFIKKNLDFCTKIFIFDRRFWFDIS